jgi:hypothetical protein
MMIYTASITLAALRNSTGLQKDENNQNNYSQCRWTRYNSKYAV